jgi:hypothetical protein
VQRAGNSIELNIKIAKSLKITIIAHTGTTVATFSGINGAFIPTPLNACKRAKAFTHSLSGTKSPFVQGCKTPFTSTKLILRLSPIFVLSRPLIMPGVAVWRSTVGFGHIVAKG